MWGEVISGAANLGSSILNNVMNARNAREANEANKQAATTAYNRQLEFWNMQNAYNDPSQAIGRLVKAGINPNAVYGNMQNSASTLSSVPQQSSSIPSQFGLDTQSVLEGVLQAKAIQKADADITNVNADTAKKESEKRLADANIHKTENEAATRYYELTELLPTQKKELERKIETMDLEAFFAEIQGQDTHLMNEIQRNLADANYREFIQDSELRHKILAGTEKEIEARAKLLAAQTYKTEQEGRLAKAAADFAINTSKVRQRALEIANDIGEQDYAMKVFQLIDAEKWSELNELNLKFQQRMQSRAQALEEKKHKLDVRKQNYVEKRDQEDRELRKEEIEIRKAAFIASSLFSLANLFKGSTQGLSTSDYQTSQLLLSM